MRQYTRTPKRISRGKATKEAIRIDGVLSCPHCQTPAGGSQEYDYDEATEVLTYFYRCRSCGKTFRKHCSIHDLYVLDRVYGKREATSNR